MKNVNAITISVIALLFSIGAIASQLISKPLGEGIGKYKFSEPLEAYKSSLKMTMNKDILAQIQFNAAISDRKIKEQLDTLKVNKTREYGGKTILFIEYNVAGLPKRDVVGMEKDSESGFWYEVYTSAFEVEDKNPKLAVEIREWEK